MSEHLDNTAWNRSLLSVWLGTELEMSWSACAGSEMMDEAFTCVWERARLDRGCLGSISRFLYEQGEPLCSSCSSGTTAGKCPKVCGVSCVRGDVAQGAIHPPAGWGQRVNRVFTWQQSPEPEAFQGAVAVLSSDPRPGVLSREVCWQRWWMAAPPGRKERDRSWLLSSQWIQSIIYRHLVDVVICFSWHGNSALADPCSVLVFTALLLRLSAALPSQWFVWGTANKVFIMHL